MGELSHFDIVGLSESDQILKLTGDGAVEGQCDHLGRLLDGGVGGAGDDGAVGRAEAVGQHALRQVASGCPGLQHESGGYHIGTN